MKVIQANLTLLISGGAPQKDTPPPKDGSLDPQQILFPQKNSGDFFSKWMSY